ncbi:peptidoglycan recognition protein family protein [Levilactobacillus tujiorum]|uniref:N-acetylmuramoyl-L-alanine amidase n=1 Tax=Levilactobacillus tujiorum TaxID=2912243 RepID=A0ABX1LAF2_9LACO|nr:N-acetylmuramoyl-L-alanine amidase [Levilactobacillus tujiorum]MCH5465075.1 N-acetylmuramoyl-L-alanine amidase [Levilactobacillus tujiorum]NLR12067.1 N-acetylmuramoyl-L-alanine amidase [Lactobacillus sp. HBUAS51387]NLR30065.1 N-acetylmuramoyl-L-alanine amidase [Levilactobacillus tujiorum]
MHKVVLTALAALGVVGILGMTNATTADASSKVNNYINDKNIKPAKITKSVWSGFPKNKYRHGKGKPEGVVIHETANPSSTIYNEIAYMKRNYNNAFVHSFVDGSRIINIANTDYLSWGVGFPGNARFVQFEQVEVHSKSAFAHEVANAAWYTAYLLNKYNLKPNDAAYDGKGTVWSHGSVAKHLGGSSHTDPVGYYSSTGKRYFGQKYTMAAFYQMVKKYYNAMNVKHTKLVSATYKSVNQQAKLSSKYKKYYLYNHVKGANKNAKRQSWSKISPKVGKTYYIDMVAKKTGSTTWYRIKPSKNTTSKTRYWVYSGNLTNIKDVQTEATATSANVDSASASSASDASSSSSSN